MTLLGLSGYVGLPSHVKPGGFGHAAVHGGLARLFVAHTANDSLDVIDCQADHYIGSIPGLSGVAGALVSEEHDLIFTSNRGENSVGIFSPSDEAGIEKVAVGVRPNGLPYAPGCNYLLVAHVGDPAGPDSFSVAIVNAGNRAVVSSIPVPERTRWAVYDSETDLFYVNIADPPRIVVIAAQNHTRIARSIEIPAAGPHRLDLDPATGRLFCACDGAKVFSLDAPSGKLLMEADLAGVPDVMFFNSARRHLYVAIGDPGRIEVFDTDTLQGEQTVETKLGAHTLGFDPDRNKLYAFLPQTHRAAVYVEQAG